MPKRTFKQADVPPLRRPVSIGSAVPIFTAADVAGIAKKVLSIKKGRSLDDVAAAWSQAFFHSADFLPFRIHDAPNQLQDFYSGVDEAARALLKALGFTGTPAFVLGEMKALNAPSADAIERLKGVLSNADAKAAPLHFAMALRVAPPGYKETDREPFNAALNAAPYAVALLALTAVIAEKAYAKAIKEERAKSGPKPSKFRHELFETLAAGFDFAFGYVPDTGSERLKKDNASQVWIAWLFRTAAERLAGCILLDMTDEAERAGLAEAHPLVCKVQELAQLKPGTLANLLAKGQRRNAAMAEMTPDTVVSF